MLKKWSCFRKPCLIWNDIRRIGCEIPWRIIIIPNNFIFCTTIVRCDRICSQQAAHWMATELISDYKKITSQSNFKILHVIFAIIRSELVLKNTSKLIPIENHTAQCQKRIKFCSPKCFSDNEEIHRLNDHKYRQFEKHCPLYTWLKFYQGHNCLKTPWTQYRLDWTYNQFQLDNNIELGRIFECHLTNKYDQTSYHSFAGNFNKDDKSYTGIRSGKPGNSLWENLCS